MTKSNEARPAGRRIVRIGRRDDPPWPIKPAPKKRTSAQNERQTRPTTTDTGQK